jgi:large conductance mechanosensitive channel
MTRIRELLAHGGVAVLAVVFALAYGVISLASALANQIISVLQQATYDRATGTGGLLEFTVWSTDISYGELLSSAIVLALVGVTLYALWRITGNERKSCPECASDVPKHASVCRYCTTELPADVA